MMSKVKLFLVLIPLLFSIILLTGCESGAVQVGDKLPDFELEKVNGGTLTLEDLDGKVVLIDFWATWCAPCRNSVPYLKKLDKEFEGEEVMILGINLDRDKTTEQIAEFVKHEGIEYTVIMGNDEFFNKFSVRGIPAFFMIDRESTIRNKYIGFDPSYFSKFSSEIKKLLEE